MNVERRRSKVQLTFREKFWRATFGSMSFDRSLSLSLSLRLFVHSLFIKISKHFLSLCKSSSMDRSLLLNVSASLFCSTRRISSFRREQRFSSIQECLFFWLERSTGYKLQGNRSVWGGGRYMKSFVIPPLIPSYQWPVQMGCVKRSRVVWDLTHT